MMRGDDVPLVGRSDQVATVWKLVRDSRCGGVVICGAGGVGKTRFCAEIEEMARRAGHQTARVAGTTAARSVPLGAFAPLLPAVEAASLRVAGQSELLRLAGDVLRKRSAGQRFVLVVDDAHLLDELSATLVYQLADSSAVFVLAVTRSDVAAPEFIVALWKDSITGRVDLPPLDHDAMAQLVEHHLGGAVDPSTVTNLLERCGGHALVLRELLDQARADGSLDPSDGIWRLTSPSRPSQRLIDIVESGLGMLTAAERAFLDALAFAVVLGPAEIRALGFADLILGLEERGLVRTERNGRRLETRLGQPIHREVLQARATAWQAREISQTLVDTLEATGTRRQEDALRLATWRLEMGGASLELTTSAAVIASSRFDFDLAERFARAALDAGGGFDAALIATQIASRPGGGDVEAALEALARCATTDAQRARVVIGHLEHRIFYGADPAASLRIADEALATISDPAWREEIEARRMAIDILLDTMSPIAALNTSKAMLERAQSGGQTWTFFQSVYAGLGLARQGRLEEALQIFDHHYEAQLMPTSLLVSPWKGVWQHLWFKVDALRHLGRFEEAQQLATEQHERALAEHSVDPQAYFAWRLAALAAETGTVTKGAFHGHEATALLRSGGRAGVAYSAAASLALVLAVAGNGREAAAALAVVGEQPFLFFPIEFRQAQAWSAVATGDLNRARDVLREAADLANRTGDLVGEAFTLHDLARIGHPELAADRLEQLAAQIDGRLAPARAEHVRGLVTRDAAALERVSAQFETMGATLLAAEAEADAAVAWRVSRNANRATAAEVRAVLLAGRCEGATTPALQRIDARARLTPAERQIAMLGATGRSNKAIADELFLSARTVGNHLQRVYQKLGISSRKALAEALEGLLDTDR